MRENPPSFVGLACLLLVLAARTYCVPLADDLPLLPCQVAADAQRALPSDGAGTLPASASCQSGATPVPHAGPRVRTAPDRQGAPSC
eukprot:5782384-Prymnesium_polylepis.1